jgi:redox-sensitive bicupin YhaK (pirin superfamily)
MTAASGVVHEEKHSREFTRRGGTLEMVQLWVNLPAEFKMSAPAYQTILERQIPSVDLPDGAGTVRVIAGEFAGAKGPAQTFTPINLWELRLKALSRAELNLPPGFTAALFILRGEVALSDCERARETDLALLTREGELLRINARDDATLLVLNGATIDEPVAAHGPFVMNREAEITQAIEDYHSGRLGRLAA